MLALRFSNFFFLNKGFHEDMTDVYKCPQVKVKK